MKKKTVFAVLFILLGIGGFLAYKFLGPAVSTPSGEFFYVRTGAGFSEMRDSLIEKKYLSNDTWFNLAARALKPRRRA